MTDTVSLSVKWGKETITLDFIVAGGVKGLKTELEEKTRVPADRMKLMAKSKGMFVFLLLLNVRQATHVYDEWHSDRIFTICRSMEGSFEG